MSIVEHLFENNRVWAAKIRAQDSNFFNRLAYNQSPEYLWIGCADSRVPAEQILNLSPGSMFVHRNVANVVLHADLNCLSVMQFAVDVLHVKHIIVCGHYSCGGVKAVLHGERLGLVDHWLRAVQDVHQKHRTLIVSIKDENRRLNKLCELNVIEQAISVCRTTVVQNAWASGQELTVHAWIYGLHDGLLRDLKFCVFQSEDVELAHHNAINNLYEINSGIASP